MKRTARDNRDLPHPKPVERIELSQEHAGPRLAAAAALLLLGAGLLAYTVMGLLTPDTGWQTVQADSGASCAEDFTFLYQADSSAEAKGVASLYSDACRKAFQLFHNRMAFDGVTNVYTINRHPNEVLEVDEALYEAFAVIVGSGRRELYLGPVYERYGGVFSCEDDVQLVDFDPRLSEDVRQEYAGVLVYANDPQAVSLELLGEGRIRLNVSEAYLDWAEEEEITSFIDFSWMQNAFVADYLAGELTARGYTKGTLSSYDGFIRNLDGRDVGYTYPIYHRQEDAIYPAAQMQYHGPVSLVRMRDYPLNQEEFQRYYELRTGEVRTLYLDMADALCKSSIDTLVCCSREKGCAQILMEMIPVYIADDFREEAVAALAEEGIQSVYCRGWEVLHTEPGLTLESLFDDGDRSYTVRQIGR